MRIKSDLDAPKDKDIKRLVLCSGKVAYDLYEARDAAGGQEHVDRAHRAAYIPFPGEPLIVRLKRMKNLETLIWCQEEPLNQGSWMSVRHYLEDCLDPGRCRAASVPIYAGREPSASPATGLAKQASRNSRNG